MRLLDIFLALAFVFLSAVSLIVQKMALSDIGVIPMNFLRMALLGILVPFVWRSRPEKFGWLILVSLTANVLNCVFIGYALQTNMNLSVSATLVQTNAMFGVIFAYIFFKEKIKMNSILGMGLACYGIYLLTGVGVDGAFFHSGVIFILISSLFWGIGVTLMKKHSIGRNPSDIIWMSLVSSALMMPVLAWSSSDVYGIFNFVKALTLKAVICIAIAAFMSTLLATMLLVRLTQKYNSQLIMPFMLLFPVFSGMLAWCIFDETPTKDQFFASTIILFGVSLTQPWTASFHTLVIDKCRLLWKKGKVSLDGIFKGNSRVKSDR